MISWLAKIESAKSLAELWRVVRTYYREQGFTAVAYLVPGRIGENPNEMIVIHHGFPAKVVEAYTQDYDIGDDPLPRFSRTQGVAGRWSELWQLFEPDERQLKFRDDMRAAGIGDGFALPVFGPLGRNASVSVGEPVNEAALDDAPVSEMQMLAQAAHLHLCTLMPDPNPLERPLSARELEILDWVAKGKSNSVIAEILELSGGTVDTYLRRIYEKMNVSDRTSAAVRAVSMGLIAA